MSHVLQATALGGILSVLCRNVDREVQQNWLQAGNLNCGSNNNMLVEKYDARRLLSVWKPSLTQTRRLFSKVVLL